MPRRIDAKCLACAQLSTAVAKQQHGPTGDDCWHEKRCPRRRSHYRNRRDSNAKRRTQYRQKVSEHRASVETLEVELLLPPVAYLYLYREKQQDAPLHAIAVSVWQGDEKILEVKPMHCAGLRNQKIQAYLKEILAQLQERYGIHKFEPAVRLSPMSCPIANCALKEAP